ncbi:MAG: hypothetical protein AB7U30_09500 [Sulfuricellaceae bacterium]|jgi:hypothetical protein
MPKTIPDFTERELWAVETAVKERYCKAVEIQQADVELRLDPVEPVLTDCPAVVWQEGKCTFLVAKVGENRFRPQFFYSVREQYGTGQTEYNDLVECVITLLKIQADHESKRSAAEQSA